MFAMTMEWKSSPNDDDDDDDDDVEQVRAERAWPTAWPSCLRWWTGR